MNLRPTRPQLVDGRGGDARPVQVEDYERLGRAQLPKSVWDFVQGGSGTETTLRANRSAFDRLRLRPRVLVDVATPDIATTLLGDRISAPVGIAPMGYHGLADPEGEVATARAAGELGLPMVVSMFASRTLAEIAAATRAPLWLQLYMLRRRDVLRDLVQQAEATGYRALVLTVDAPRLGRRLRDVRGGFTLPPGIRAMNIDPSVMAACHQAIENSSAIERHGREHIDPALTWDDLDWLRAQSGLPLLLKGILTAEDAELALRHGVDGVIVSNHGGRQLDHAVAGIDAVPEVVAAACGRYPVIVDGGIRHGVDVLKALALGADAAFVGRPVLWGLAASGAAGVADVLRLLCTELEDAMVLAGRPRLADVDGSLVRRPTDHIG